jgi:hypothetical protein
MSKIQSTVALEDGHGNTTTSKAQTWHLLLSVDFPFSFKRFSEWYICVTCAVQDSNRGDFSSIVWELKMLGRRKNMGRGWISRRRLLGASGWG